MKQKIRWGILGTGTIANTFAKDLMLSEGSILQGVASRTVEKAEAFGFFALPLPQPMTKPVTPNAKLLLFWLVLLP